MRPTAPSLTADEIAARVPDGATVALAASGIFLEPDAILAALERRFLQTGHPCGLTVIHALGIGDGAGSGLGRLAHEGMVRRVIGGHWSWSPAMQALAAENLVEAYTLPGGVIALLLREIGAGRPGLITRIGLDTFADPRRGGGRANAAATGDLVELIDLDGREWLRYRPLPVDVAIIRASAADPAGNLTLRDEPCNLDVLAAAMAARASGGQVLAQVRRRLDGPIRPARLAQVPGVLVDALHLAPEARDTYLPAHDPRVTGAAPPPDAGEEDAASPEAPAGPALLRHIIAARALREIPDENARRASVNFGFGIPGGIPALAAAAGVRYWGSVEQGIHNGALFDGPMFGAARDAEAILPSPDQFDFYSGGGIDIAFLGMGEMDGAGNVNVSRMGGRLVGPGGFVDITQTARTVVFCGAFEAKGLELARDAEGRLSIVTPGQIPKLVAEVGHVTFSGPQARRNGQRVLYITERAVFRLGAETGVELVELMPGIDLQRDVLGRMRFVPVVALGG